MLSIRIPQRQISMALQSPTHSPPSDKWIIKESSWNIMAWAAVIFWAGYMLAARLSKDLIIVIVWYFHVQFQYLSPRNWPKEPLPTHSFAYRGSAIQFSRIHCQPQGMPSWSSVRNCPVEFEEVCMNLLYLVQDVYLLEHGWIYWI